MSETDARTTPMTRLEKIDAITDGLVENIKAPKTVAADLKEISKFIKGLKQLAKEM